MDACRHLIIDGWSRNDLLIVCQNAAVDWLSWRDSGSDCGGGLAALTQRLHPDEFADADIGHTQSADGEAEVESTRLDREALGRKAEAPQPQESPSAVEQHAQPCEDDCAPDAGSTDFAKLLQNVASEAEGHTAARTGKGKKKKRQRKRNEPDAVAAATACVIDEAVEQHAQSCEDDCAQDAGSTDFAKLHQNVDSEAEGHTAGARTGKSKKKHAPQEIDQEVVAAAAARLIDEAVKQHAQSCEVDCAPDAGSTDFAKLHQNVDSEAEGHTAGAQTGRNTTKRMKQKQRKKANKAAADEAIEQHAQSCEDDCTPDAGSTDFAKLHQNVDSEAEGHTAGARTGKRKKNAAQRKRAYNEAVAAARQADELARPLRGSAQLAEVRARIEKHMADRATKTEEMRVAWDAYTVAQQCLDAHRALGKHEAAEETTTEAQGLHLQFSEQ